jgi:hypothetical protein
VPMPRHASRKMDRGTATEETHLLAQQAQAMYACATPPLAGGDAQLLVTALTGTAHCARFRLQVLKEGSYALRSAAIGLWVLVSPTPEAHGALIVAAPNPLLEPAAAFNFSATHLPPR